MIKNLERILNRGEKIELIVTTTEEMKNKAVNFRKTSSDIKRHYWWKNAKLWIILAVVLVVRPTAELRNFRSILPF